jgi:anti-anti-sigma factor
MIQLISRHSELDVDNNPILLLPVRLTIVESVALKKSCMQLLEGNSPSKKLILDFGQNTFIGSSGIGTLVTLYKAAISQGIELILKNVLPQAMMVLELTQLDQFLTIELSEQHPGDTINSSGNQLPKTHSSVGSLKSQQGSPSFNSSFLTT